MSDSPYAPTSTNLGNADPGRDKLRRVAKHQRLVIFALLASIGSNIVAVVAGGQPPAIQLVVLAMGHRCRNLTMVSVFMLANELYNAGIGTLCAILMIVPCVSLIVLLVVNQKATSLLQSNGVRVGFFGTHPDKV